MSRVLQRSSSRARLLRIAFAAAWLGAVPTLAAAQDEILLGHLELSGGAGMAGGASLGSLDADLRSPTPDQPYRLFTTTSRIARAPLFDMRVGVALSQRYAVEGHVAYGRPELRTEISSDAESAPAITAVEKIDQFVIDGGVVVHFGPLGAGVRPFVTAGAGYLRQLHEGRVVVEDGSVFYAGGGLKYGLMSRSDGLIKVAGLRGDARLNVLSGGIRIEDGVRRHVAVSGGLYLVF